MTVSVCKVNYQGQIESLGHSLQSKPVENKNHNYPSPPSLPPPPPTHPPNALFFFQFSPSTPQSLSTPLHILIKKWTPYLHFHQQPWFCVTLLHTQTLQDQLFTLYSHFSIINADVYKTASLKISWYSHCLILFDPWGALPQWSGGSFGGKDLSEFWFSFGIHFSVMSVLSPVFQLCFVVLSFSFFFFLVCHQLCFVFPFCLSALCLSSFLSVGLVMSPLC